MDFYEVLEQVMELLQREGRVSYRVLKRQFSLDDDFIEGELPTSPREFRFLMAYSHPY